jgi:hypothetical protein
LKRAFHIPATDISPDALHLLVEWGSDTVSFVWMQKNPLRIEGISTYTFNPAEENQEELISFPDNDDFKAASVTLCYNNRESALVPVKYYQAGLQSALLALQYGETENKQIRCDALQKRQIMNCYYGSGCSRLGSARQISLLQKCCMQLHFRPKSISVEAGCSVPFTAIHLKVILHKDGQLLFVQQFGYATPGDAVYHLLNTCQQHHINPAEINLQLSGMVDQQSPLFQMMHTYFANISFMPMPAGITVQEKILELPEHFFSHLIELASCAS